MVLVIPGLGVQISSSNWLGYTSTVFLPHTVIGDIIINEGITRVTLSFTTSTYSCSLAVDVPLQWEVVLMFRPPLYHSLQWILSNQNIKGHFLPPV